MKIIDWKQRISQLDEHFDNLKKEEVNGRWKDIVDNFYDLKFEICDLTHDELLFVHVKLHNSWCFKRTIVPRDKIKEIHDLVAERLHKHNYYDSLDD